MSKEDDPPAFTFESLKGEWVTVRAQGFVYRGLLIGADDEELYLRGELRWVVLRLADVSEVRAERGRGAPRGERGGPDPPDEPNGEEP